MFVLGDALKARLAGGDLIDAGVEGDESVESRGTGDGVLRHSGCRVQQDYLGTWNESPAWIGDQAADAASAGLGKRDRSRAEEKNTKREKIPHGFDHSISAIHNSLPTKSRNAIFNSSGVVMHGAGNRAGILGVREGRRKCDLADRLLNRMNIAFFEHIMSRQKRGRRRERFKLAQDRVLLRDSRPYRVCVDSRTTNSGATLRW